MADVTVYMLLCSDQSYYVGRTTDLKRRLAEHEDGTGAGYTRRRRPVRLVWHEVFDDDLAAGMMERRLKGWSRAKKAALVRKDWAELKRLSKPPSRR